MKKIEIETWKAEGFTYLKYNGKTYILLSDFQHHLNSMQKILNRKTK